MPSPLLASYRKNLADQGVFDPRSDDQVIAETLGPYAEQNPGTFDQDPELAQQYGALREANAPSLGSEASRGFKRGGLGLLSTGLGGLSLFTGPGWLRDKAAQLDQASSSPDLAPTIPMVSDIGPGQSTLGKVFSKDTARYALGKFGEAAPSIAEAVGLAVGGGAAGSAVEPGVGTVAGAAEGAMEGILGRGIIRSAIKEVLKKAEVAGLEGVTEDSLIAGIKAGDEATTAAVTKAAKDLAGNRWGNIANAANSYLLNSGDVLQEVPDRPDLAAGLGVMSALPDTILPALIIRKLFPGVSFAAGKEAAKELVGSKASALLKKIGIVPAAMAGEYANEYYQEAIDVVARNIRDGKDALFFTPADLRRFNEAGITGAAGGLLASPGLAFEGKPEEVEAPPGAPPAAPVTPEPSTGPGIAPPAIGPLPGAPPATNPAMPVEYPEGQAAPAPPEAPPVRQPNSDYQYTIFRTEPDPRTGGMIPGYIQIDPIVNEGRGEPLTDAQRAELPQPPDWMPTGTYTLDQIQAAIKQGPPQAPAVLPTAQSVTPVATTPSLPSEPVIPKEAGVPSTTAIDQNTSTISGIPFREENVPVNEIQVNVDIPQFKAEANPKTGVVEGNALSGQYEKGGTAPIVIWEKNNGNKEVITGRHRLDLMKRSGGVTIPAQVVREKDGFTREMALIFDAESNIRDGQGTVKDYAQYFRGTSDTLSRSQAEARGLLSRREGNSGWSLGRDATDALYTLYANGQIAEPKAVAIARGAPGHEAAQASALKLAKTKTAPELELYARNLARSADQASQGGEQLGFGGIAQEFADMEKEAAAIADVQSRKISENTQLINAASGAAKNPEAARKMGLPVDNPAALQAKVSELRAANQQLENPDTTTYEALRTEAGLPSRETTTKPTDVGRSTLPGAEMPFNLAGEVQKPAKPALPDLSMNLFGEQAGRSTEPTNLDKVNEELRRTKEAAVADHPVTITAYRAEDGAMIEFPTTAKNAESALTREIALYRKLLDCLGAA